jgi:hypothetical protein
MSGEFPFELGAYARKNDPATSHKAVTRRNAMRWGTQCYRLLAQYVLRGPLTDEEAAVAAGLVGTARSPWRRCTELRQSGFITDTGKERVSSAGSPQRVCAVTDKGLHMAAALQ